MDIHTDIKSTALPFDPFYTDSNYNFMRKIKAIILSDTLMYSHEYIDLPYNKKIQYLISIENSCFNETIKMSKKYNIRCDWEDDQFINIYHTTCYNLFSALNTSMNAGSKNLLKRIFNGEVDLSKIASFSCRELCPEIYEDIAKRIEIRSTLEENIKPTQLYFCRKCKKNTTTAQKVQNRSNDEGNSYHVTCLFCHNRWFSK